MKNCNLIRRLTLENTMANFEDVDEKCVLKELNLSRNLNEGENFDKMFNALSHVNLKCLILEDNKENINRKSFTKLNLNFLQKLNIKGSYIGKLGMDFISTAPILEEIYLDGN